MKIRPATSDDLQQWFGGVPASMRAIVMEKDGAVLGIAGVAVMADHIQAFSAEKPELSGHKFAKGRAAAAFAKLLAQAKGPVFAICSETELTAPRLLTHLGFVPVAERRWRYG